MTNTIKPSSSKSDGLRQGTTVNQSASNSKKHSPTQIGQASCHPPDQLTTKPTTRTMTQHQSQQPRCPTTAQPAVLTTHQDTGQDTNQSTSVTYYHRADKGQRVRQAKSTSASVPALLRITPDLYQLTVDKLGLTTAIPLAEQDWLRTSMAQWLQQGRLDKRRRNLKYKQWGILVLQRGKQRIDVLIACDPYDADKNFLYLELNPSRFEPEHKVQLRDALLELCGAYILEALKNARINRLDLAFDFINQKVSNRWLYPIDMLGRTASRQHHDNGSCTDHFGAPRSDIQGTDYSKDAEQHKHQPDFLSQDNYRRFELRLGNVGLYEDLDPKLNSAVEVLEKVNLYDYRRMQRLAIKEKRGVSVKKKTPTGKIYTMRERPTAYVSTVLEYLGDGTHPDDTNLSDAIYRTAKWFAPDDATKKQLNKQRERIRQALKPALLYQGVDVDRVRQQLPIVMEPVHELMTCLTTSPAPSKPRGSGRFKRKPWPEHRLELAQTNQPLRSTWNDPAPIDWDEPDELDDIDE